MNICVQCGGEDFITQDGFMYCTMCSMQSQTAREEVNNLDDTDFLSKSVRVKVIKKSKKEKGDPESTSTWTHLEVYNLILKKCVDSLLALGVSQQIRPAVKGIWAKYIQKVGIIVGKEDELDESIKISHGFAARVTDMKNTAGTLLAVLGEKPKKEERRKIKKCNAVDKLTVSKLVGLLYAAALRVDRRVLFTDLYRWSKQGDIPLLQTTSLLPPEVKFTAGDRMVFTQTDLLSQKGLWDYVVDILKFLDVDLNQHEGPCNELLIARYVLQLNLPGQLVGPALNLTGSGCFNDLKMFTGLVPPEVDALVLIIITMVTLFGLDGRTELEMSEYARILQRELDTDDLFVWDEWKANQDLQAYRNKLTDIHSVHDCSQATPEVSKIVAVYDVIAKNQEIERTKAHFLSAKTEVKEAVRNPFKRLTTEDRASQSRLFAESFPERRDFTTTRLDFILRPEAYNKQLRAKGYKVKTIKGPAEEGGKSNVQETSVHEDEARRTGEERKDKRTVNDKASKRTVYLFVPSKRHHYIAAPDPRAAMFELLPSQQQQLLTYCSKVTGVDISLLTNRLFVVNKSFGMHLTSTGTVKPKKSEESDKNDNVERIVWLVSRSEL